MFFDEEFGIFVTVGVGLCSLPAILIISNRFHHLICKHLSFPPPPPPSLSLSLSLSHLPYFRCQYSITVVSVCPASYRYVFLSLFLRSTLSVLSQYKFDHCLTVCTHTPDCALHSLSTHYLANLILNPPIFLCFHHCIKLVPIQPLSVLRPLMVLITSVVDPTVSYLPTHPSFYPIL